MSEYHKIQSIFKRDMSSPRKALIVGDWSMPEFEYLAYNEWVFTEKVDGTNIRVMHHPDTGTMFGGRTDNANIHAQLLNRLNERFLPLRALLDEKFPEGVVLYGEGYGAGIQKVGVNYRPDKDFVLFDVRVGRWWLQRQDVEGIASMLGLDVVPVVGRSTLFDAIDIVREGIRSAWGDFQAEGVVARPAVELARRDGSRIIAKIKCRDFQ